MTATTALAVPDAVLPAVADLAETADRAMAYARDAKAENTRRAYGLAWADFAAWCAARELVALNLADLRFVPEGMVLTIRKAKTDQEGAGAEIAIPHGSSDVTCPVRALRAWLEAAGIKAGALF